MKICAICNEKINKNKEYCKLVQYDKQGNLYKTTFYHTECFTKQLLQKRELNKQAKEAHGVLMKLTKRFGLDKEEDKGYTFVNKKK